MEVGRKNFNEVLPRVRESIDKADFLVIDAEFSGLKNGRDGSIFDSPKDYYYRMLSVCTDFTLLQYGLSAFYWDADKREYMNETYSFYLFPRGKQPDKVFLCQSSSLDFLNGQGFDFNKWIGDGISYMTEPVETKLRETLTEKHSKLTKVKNIVAVPDENKSYVEEICTRVREFLDNEGLDDIEIDRCNSFQRLLLFQELNKKFQDKIILETKILEDSTRVMKVTRVKPGQDTSNHDKQKREQEWQDLEDAVGFSKVARMISQSEKLVIGHNMLLDVMHTLNHFFQPLPNDYELFKEFTSCMFPCLLDTKYMSSLPPFKDKVQSSVLVHLLATLSEPPFSLPNIGSVEGRGYTGTEARAHEAGYDAFITGKCFLAMLTHLGKMRGEEHVRCDVTSPILRPFLNKIYLSRTAYQDSAFMNFAGSDPTPNRDHVFYLTFPREWTRNEINHLFSPFGAITVQFEDDCHALVALSRRDQARAVLRTLRGNTTIHIISYDEYKRNLTRYEYTPDYSQHRLIMITKNSEEETQKIQKTEGTVSPTSTTSTNQAVQKQQKPRTRAQSLSLSQSTHPVTRKRTSSGVFQVDEKQPVGTPQTIRSSKSDGGVKKDNNGKNKKSTQQPSPVQEKRKRTSSGVFQADDLEPPSKKELTVEAKKKSNGRRKEKEIADKQGATKKKKNIIERFDSEVKNVCVTAFKESDSWD